MDRQKYGKIGENAASNYLINNNYRIIHRNVHIGRFGEIDIIAEQKSGFWPLTKKTLVFVEVKALTSLKENLGFNPEMHVNERKKRKLLHLGEMYMQNNDMRLDTPWRIDVIAVELDKTTADVKNIRHHENAVHL